MSRSTLRRHLPLRHVAVVAAACLAAAGAPVAATAGGDGIGDIEITVDDVVTSPTPCSLPPAPEVGQVAGTTMTFEADLDVQGGGADEQVSLGMAVETTTEVTEVTADNGWITLTTLDAIEVTDAPAGADAAGAPCVGVSGLQLEETWDRAGQSVSWELVGDDLGPAQQACADQLSSTQSQVPIVFPPEPVGPGARWTADLEVVSQGFTFPVSYHYTLRDLADGVYTLDVTFDSEFEVESQGFVFTGTMTGSGTMGGSIEQPVGATASMTMHLEMRSDVDGEELSMSMDMTVEMRSRQLKQ